MSSPLDVPFISVETTSNITVEGNGLTIACKIQAGNPEEITIFFWEFVPKYKDTLSQVQLEMRELRIEETVYSDAGTYRCTAGNTLGSGTGEIQIVVQCEY